MITFGKVLIVLNVLAAAGVAYFATENWSRRQSLNATGLRYAITKYGLPNEPEAGQPAALTSTPADDDAVAIRLPTGTGRYTEDVPFRLLKAQFTGADGRQPFGDAIPPVSVQGEVKRARTAVYGFLRIPSDRANWNPDAATTDAALNYLCGQLNPQTGLFTPGLLALLADGFGERQVIKRLLVFPNVAAGGIGVEKQAALLKAVAMLDKRFDAVTNAPNAAAAATDTAALQQAQQTVAAAELASRNAHQSELKLLVDLKGDPENKQIAEQLETATKETKAARVNLTAALDSFETVLANIGLAASRDEVDRRRRALTLLSHLDHAAPDGTWQKRVMLVFGQPEYVASQKDRSDKLVTYPPLLTDERDADDARYYAEYERMKQAASDRFRFAEAQDVLKKEAEAQVAAAAKLFTQRKQYLEERLAVVADLNAKMKSLATEQELTESELFNLQLKVGKLLRENFELEDRLIQAEKQAVPPVGR